MYVAFRWLITLVLAKWLALCCLDIYLTEYKTRSTAIASREFFKFSNASEDKLENKTEKWNVTENYKHPGFTIHHYVMFLAGVSVVLIYNKKSLLFVLWRKNTDKTVNFLERNITLNWNTSKITVKHVGVAISYYSKILWEILLNYVSKAAKRFENEQDTNLSLLKRLKDLAQDREALGRLLIAAVEENKNIRRKYQLEVITKNRLLSYVQQDTRRVMKENKSQYVDFQQLHLLSEKENYMLKNNIRFLKEEKDNAEKKLLELINVVFRSKCNDLKAYCTRFIVDTENNLLNSDASAEIQKFLLKSEKNVMTSVDDRFENILHSSSKPIVTEILDDDRNLLNSSGPKLQGLPGEFVWTIKDKNGIIEKLYEYNCETDNDNGDIIRRIRRYSVYHDNDSVLDHMNLATIMPLWPSLSASATRIRLDIKSISSQGFLTKALLKNCPLLLQSTEENLPLPNTTYDS